MASNLLPYPMPPDGALPTVNLAALQGHVLGATLEGNTAWFIDSGAATRRTVLTTPDKIVNRAINAADSTAQLAFSSTANFSERFNTVIGREGTADKAAFERLGSNLINALAGLQQLSTDLVTLPNWNSEEYILTFITGAGDQVEVNLPLESLAQGLDYDASTKEIILIKQDSSEIRVSVADLVTFYEGLDSATVSTKVTIDNKIIASIVLHSIEEKHLSTDLLETLGNSAAISTQQGNALQRVADGLFVPNVTATQISQQAYNVLEQKPDGLYVPDTGGGGSDNFVGVVLAVPETQTAKLISPIGTMRPAAYLAGQLYAILFTNGHTAPALQLSFGELQLKDVAFNNNLTFPTDLILAGSMHLFVYNGTNFSYVGRHYDMPNEGIFTTDTLPDYLQYGTLSNLALTPISAGEHLTLDSVVLDKDGRLAKVKGIDSNLVTVFTIKEAAMEELRVDEISIRYSDNKKIQAVAFANHVRNNSIGKVSNQPGDLAFTELMLDNDQGNHRIVSVLKTDGTPAWQLRIDKAAITNINQVDDNDDLLNRGQIYELLKEAEGTGLRIPIYLDLESQLPAITDQTPDGAYYIVSEMDITAPGREGRVWVNLSISATKYQMVINKGKDADNDWILIDQNNAYTFNTQKIVTDLANVDIQTDTGLPVSIDALLQVDSKISNSFRGRVRDEDAFPVDALAGHWVMIDDCNHKSPGNPGLAVFDGTNWIVCAFEAGAGQLEVIPEPDADGQLYLRSRDFGQPGRWVQYTAIDGTTHTITSNVKNLSDPDDAVWIPAQGELIYIADEQNFTIGDGVGRLNALPLMFVKEAQLEFTPENIANRAMPNGYVPLDGNAKVPLSYLPESVADSVSETVVENIVYEVQQLLQTTINTEIVNRQIDTTELQDEITGHTTNGGIHVTPLEKQGWNAKLDQSSLQPLNNHLQDSDIHVTLSDKLRWDGNMAAILVNTMQEMLNIDPATLKLGDICFVRLTNPGVTPAQYDKYVWYGIDGWQKEQGAATVIDLDWASIINKPAASAMEIDSAITQSHKHVNQLVLNNIGQNAAGNLTYNGVPIGATIFFLQDESLLPAIGQTDALYVIYQDRRLTNFPSISVWKGSGYEILGRGLGDSSIVVGDMVIQQKELFGVVGGSEFMLTLAPSLQFAFMPMEVLKMVPGATNQTMPYSNFSNPYLFTYHHDLMKIQSGVYIGAYELTMELYAAAGLRNYFSKTIDITNYHSVTEMY
ncbi:MAG: hypothetical protein FWE40_02935 [Oscillospiraceae bacterium]|nr:hypothetical protein [Oscillospiraceae bacterium]